MNKEPVITKKEVLAFVLVVSTIFSLCFVGAYTANYFFFRKNTNFLNPVIKLELVVPENDIEVPEEDKNLREFKFDRVEPKKTTTLEGEASYYSVLGCLDCHPEQIMANGDVFDENELTLAIGLKPETTVPLIPLNKNVKVCNLENEYCTIARVTDTGGFYSETYNWRVADLSKATKEVLNCSDLCKVKIELL